ncbi:hypothetical protein EZV62_006994 [Acer yangbiense]|uniref:Disease resistance protein At4g27190-like leucine-rich repeats domain-containing protein n=1 Tax=Acer yangbiense TaxID=1000413 RepID=A0A5C7IAE9_9ROSI|nr:hypothetical protein EZV62_006994 [Acer yangbiense]
MFRIVPTFCVLLNPWHGNCSMSFPESLSLHNLINLKKICYGPLVTKSFCNLKKIKVRNCDKLKNIFSLSIAKGLPQLEVLEVIACKNMEGIFVVGREDDVNNDKVIDTIEFGQLRSLTLKSLPQLRSFCLDVKTPYVLQNTQKLLTDEIRSNEVVLEDELDTPMALLDGKLQHLMICKCSVLEEITVKEQAVFPNLEDIIISHMDNLEMIRCLPKLKYVRNKDPQGILSFQNLRAVRVSACQNLKILFPASISISLLQLEELDMYNCGVEEIISKEGEAKAAARFVFPRMTSLRLCKLAELRNFYPGIHNSEWPMLKKLELY